MDGIRLFLIIHYTCISTLKGLIACEVSCGGSFTILRATSPGKASPNYLYSWGLITGGRLGHGKQYELSAESNLDNRMRRRSRKYLQLPTRITALQDSDIVRISAGTNHVLALSSNGDVFSWGSNKYGQCGVLPIHPLELTSTKKKQSEFRMEISSSLQKISIWDDVWVPRKLPKFGSTGSAIAKHVSAGSTHSAAIDSLGKVWTWGGGGRNSCLGHADPLDIRFGVNENEFDLKKDYLLLSGCMDIPKWATPHIVAALTNENISKVELGNEYSVALTNSGKVYLWGERIAALEEVGTYSI